MGQECLQKRLSFKSATPLKQKVAWYDEVLICDYNTCKEFYSVWVLEFYLLLRRVVGQKLRKKEKCDVILKNGVKLDGVVNTVVYETMV